MKLYCLKGPSGKLYLSTLGPDSRWLDPLWCPAPLFNAARRTFGGPPRGGALYDFAVSRGYSMVRVKVVEVQP